MRRALKILDNNHHDAEDAVQDAWSHIFANLERLQFENETLLSTYIMITVEGRARHIREKRQRRHGILTEEDPTELGDSCSDPVLYRLCAAETVREIKEAITRMKPIYRDTLVLSLLYDFPLRFIAETLKIKPTTAHMRLQRGKAMLAEMLRKKTTDD